MQYNYLDILRNNGFKLPCKEESYDDVSQIYISDKRIPELIAIIRLAFQGMIYKGLQDGNLLFKTLDGTRYEVKITDMGITCTTIKNDCLDSLYNQRDFTIIRNEEGDYTFTRIEFLDNDKGIIEKRTLISRPDYHNNYFTIVNAYDKDTLYLFKQYIEKSDPVTNYLALLQTFLETMMILPDISRKIIFQASNFKTCLREEDLIDKEYSRNNSNVSLDGSFKVAFPVIESYIRARNYARELTIAKGLSNSVEDEIKLKIKYSKLPHQKPEK